jgi:predicted metallopeptidase
MEPICNKCPNFALCRGEEMTCKAYDQLIKIQREYSIEKRAEIMRELSVKLGIRDAEPNEDMQTLAEAVIQRFEELWFINVLGIRIGYVLSYENKQGQKITYADCRKLMEVYKAYLPFDFIITFYYFNTERLSENQKKILMLHELKHIQVNERGLSVKPHDIEDFKDILDKYGNEWNEMCHEVPDILGGEEHE